MLAFVYITYCAAGWFGTRGTLAYYSTQADLPSWFTHDAWAFFIGGLLPILIYGLITTFVFKPMQARTGGGNIASLRNGLHYSVMAANVLLFLLKLMYFGVPLAATMLEILLDPIITLAFVGLYMWYAFYMDYVDKSRYRIVLMQVFGSFLLIYGLLVLINLITVVL